MPGKSAAPGKSVVLSSYRVIPKPGRAKQLGAALAARARKYKGDFAWRVGEVMSGPEAGAYHISEATIRAIRISILQQRVS